MILCNNDVTFPIFIWRTIKHLVRVPEMPYLLKKRIALHLSVATSALVAQYNSIAELDDSPSCL